MSDLANAWRTDSDVQPILDRAHHYWVQVYSVSGAPPDRFIVTEDEFARLQMYQQQDMRLFGMRVCQPERFLWYRDNRYMEHFRISALTPRPIQTWDPLPCLPAALGCCRTELPPTPRREVTCPCGEVIWDMSTCVQYAPLGELIRHPWYYGPRLPGTNNDPLPPIDDLDEGLQCCGRQYQTFGQFMAHRRLHGEG